MSTTSTTQLTPLLTPHEVAQLIGVTTGTLACWRSQHRYNLPWSKIGRLCMYQASDIQAFIEERRVQIAQQQ